MSIRSRPTRARGLKHDEGAYDSTDISVAPHAGAWIETTSVPLQAEPLLVAPHAGAWIETMPYARCQPRKSVAPHAGAWIETLLFSMKTTTTSSRAPRGRVD